MKTRNNRAGELAARASALESLQPSDASPAAWAESPAADVEDKTANLGGIRRSGLWFSVGRSAGMKILVLPLSAILGVVNVRLIIDHFGLSAYAQYGILVAIGNLLPFADLGISAAVMNVVGQSTDPRTDDRVRGVLLSAIRVLLCSFAVLVAVAGVITAGGLWPDLLGQGIDPRTGPLTAALCVAAIAVSLLFGFGQRILAGHGRNHVSVGLLGLQTPVVLVVLILVIKTNSPIGPYIAVIPYVATLLIQIVITVVAARFIRPVLGQVLRDVPKIRLVRGGRVFDMAWPMLVQLLAVPLAMQTDRLMLSHFSTKVQLAEYNLASQMFIPVWQVVSAAGFALWPIFAKQRTERITGSPVPISLAFGGAAALATTVIAFSSPWLARLASGGSIQLSFLLIGVFSGLMIVQALKYPLGMYLTDAAGLRFQAYMILLMATVNIAISYWLALKLGAPGPVIGSLVGVTIFEFLANLWFVRRRLAGRAMAST